MKFLAHLATHTLIASRLTTVSGNKKAFTTTTGFKAAVQPISASKQQMYEGAVGKTFQIYADGSLDVQEGDQLRDTFNGKYYKVKNGGVSRRTHGGLIDFHEIIVEEIT